MSYQPGKILLGKYRIEEQVGVGAFGDVYCATHLELNTIRALKVLRRDKPGLGSTLYGEFEQRFLLESRLGASLNHPNLVQVYDFERDGDNLVLVMEYAARGSLGKVLAQIQERKQAMPIATAVTFAAQIADGLGALHARGVVHRDLKPNNVLFDRNWYAKVADLGLAQIPSAPSLGRAQLSGDGGKVTHPGTLAYMSPEQGRLTTYLQSTSDIFALGCVLFEILTGRVYRDQKTGCRASKLRPGTSEWLDDLLARMLAEDPDKRPWDGQEAAALLRAGVLSESDSRPPINLSQVGRPRSQPPESKSQPQKTTPPTKKKKQGLGMLSGLGFLAIGLLLFCLIGIALLFNLPALLQTPTATQPALTTVPEHTQTPVPRLEHDVVIPETITPAPSADILAPVVYLYGWLPDDQATKDVLAECPTCQVIYLAGIEDLPDGWYHSIFHSGTVNANPGDSCRTKQELLNGQYLRFMTNNFSLCPVLETTLLSGNLIQNFDFEQGLYEGNWEWGRNAEAGPGYKSDISICSIQDFGANKDASWVGFHQDVPVKPGTHYALTAWLNWVDGASIHAKVFWFDIDGQEIRVDYPAEGFNGTSNGWVRRGSTVYSPSKASTARVAFWHGVSAENINIPRSKLCVDNIVFAEPEERLIQTSSRIDTFVSATPGARKIFSRYSVGLVSYPDIWVDDMLIGVNLVCGATSTEITDYFELIEQSGETLPHYRSREFTVQDGCRIDFDIQDSIGLNIGIGGTEVVTKIQSANTLIGASGAIPTSAPTWTPVLPEVKVNLLRNHSFENGLGPFWLHSERHQIGLYEVADYNGSGKAYCSRQNLTSTEEKGWVGFVQDVKVEPGQTYLFSAWVKLEKAIQFHVHATWYNGPAESGWALVVPTVGMPPDGETTNGWVLIRGEVKIPENVNRTIIGFWHGVVDDMRNVDGSAFCADEVIFGKLDK